MKPATEEEVRAYLKTQKAYAHIMRYDGFEFTRNLVMEHTKDLGETASFGLRVKVFLGEVQVEKCPVCGKNCHPHKDRIAFQTTCGDHECISVNLKEKAKRTSLEKYGTEHPLQNEEIKAKAVKTNLERYGVTNFSQTDEGRAASTERLKSNDVAAKRAAGTRRMWEKKEDQLKRMRDGLENKYGVSHSTQIEGVIEKSKQTNEDRYGGWFLLSDKANEARIRAFGVENYFQTEEFKNKNRERMRAERGTNHHRQEPYAFSHLSNAEWLLEAYKDRTITDIAEELKTSPSTVWDYINALGITKSAHGAKPYSEAEEKIASFITGLGFECLQNVRDVIPPLELDIYIPSKNLAIEFNGVYWHTEKFRERNYHQNKTLRCAELGIQLIHVWSDDWYINGKRDVILKKIKHKLGVSERIYARKCKVTIPPIEDVRRLYDENHIQGFVRATEHIGLEYQGELVACASFLNRGDGLWENVRFASSMSVVGGFSRILKMFKSRHSFNKLVTFAHMDYSLGNLYEATGFERKHTSAPSMFYTRGNKRERREGFMKHILHTKLENFDPSLTERENMAAHGYMRVFDSGTIRFELEGK